MYSQQKEGVKGKGCLTAKPLRVTGSLTDKQSKKFNKAPRQPPRADKIKTQREKQTKIKNKQKEEGWGEKTPFDVLQLNNKV